MENILFELKEGLVISLKAIRSNKIRSFLTMLSIIIGIWAVVVMTTAIKGIDASFQKGISSLGSDVLYLDKFAWFGNRDFWKMRNRRNISMDDYEKFKAMAKLPLAIAPVLRARKTVKFGDYNVEGVMIVGSNSDYVKTTNFTFNSGRFFSQIESNAARNVVVLGSEVAKNLFPRNNALNKKIKIGNKNYNVVGILDKQGSFILGSFNPDNQVFIPIGGIFKNFLNRARTSVTFNIRAKNPKMVKDTKEEAIGVMRKIRGLKYNEEEDFAVNQQEGLMNNFNSVVGVIQIAGLFITGLALFVGAIGIMNIMFVSVKERTKEIGLRKAIGAKRRTILSQFILESAVICLMGGLIGLLVAVLTSMAINQYIPTSVQFSAVILAIFVSLITGILAGFAPAYTAAKMDPVDALRYE